jgi:VWFA-related protein
MIKTGTAFWSAVLPAWLALSTAAPQSTSQDARQQQPPLQYEVSVTLKLIQVYVTDKSGKPVQDLKKDDFVVLDNGQQVTVTEFEKHSLQPAQPRETPGAAAPVVPTPLPPARELNRKFFLFFDFAFNTQKGVVKAVKAALHFLDTQVMPGDEVALLSYSMLKGITSHEYLTTNHAKVREAVAAITGKKTVGRASEIEQQYWQQAQENLAPGRGGEEGGGRQPGESEAPLLAARQESKTLVENYILKMTALAKALRLEQGQKSFLLFSTGIPNSLIYGHQSGNPTNLGSRYRFDAGDPVLRHLHEELFKELSASNCAFYIFDTRESTKVPSLFDYDERTLYSGFRDIFGSQGVFQDSTNMYRDDKTTGLDSLKRLADRTGGKFFSNINMYERNLDQVQDLTGAYYVLGYSIGEQWDGQFHEIKVDVKRKGCDVRAQSGYFNPKPFREYTSLEKQLQLFDLALNEHSPLRTPKTFSMTALAYDAGAGMRLRLVSRVPREIAEGFTAKSTEFVALAFDESGNLITLQRTVADASVYRGRDILLTSGMEAPPGRALCRFVVRDLESGNSAVASAAVNIAKPRSAKLMMYSPLLLAPRAELAHLEVRGQGKPDLYSWRDVYPYDEATCRPLVCEASSGAGKLTAILPYTDAGVEQPGLILSANLINSASGESLPVSFYLKNTVRVGAVDVELLEFSLENVPPGSYLLYFHAGDPASGALGHTYVPLSVQR